MRLGFAVSAVVFMSATGWMGARTFTTVASGPGGTPEAAATPATVDGPFRTDESPRLRFVPAAAGNEARYRVREQLAGIEFPSDAVGATSAVTGVLVLEDDGSIVQGESRFVVDLTGLTSDAGMRDRYLQRNTFQTADPTNANAVFVLTGLSGLTMPLPASGELTFRVTGDFTVRGTTTASTWNVTAQPTAQGVRGSAHTAFTFDDIGLTKPSVGRVLSVADTIRIEYDFNLVREPAG